MRISRLKRAALRDQRSVRQIFALTAMERKSPVAPKNWAWASGALQNTILLWDWQDAESSLAGRSKSDSMHASGRVEMEKAASSQRDRSSAKLEESGSSSVPIVTQSSDWDFATNYRDAMRPVLLQGGCAAWSACQRWSPHLIGLPAHLLCLLKRPTVGSVAGSGLMWTPSNRTMCIFRSTGRQRLPSSLYVLAICCICRPERSTTSAAYPPRFPSTSIGIPGVAYRVHYRSRKCRQRCCITMQSRHSR